jgi:hypothetical protein
MFRIWHIICRVAMPVLIVISIPMFLAPNQIFFRGLAIASCCVLFAWGLMGGVMGIFLSRGTLRMACPFCGQRGAVTHVPGGLALACGTCGLVYETGFMKLRLVRHPVEGHSGEQSLEDTPLELREEMALFPRGWVYFRQWRSLRWYLVMLLVPAAGLAAACWRGHVVGGCIVFVLSAICGAVLFVFLQSGISSSHTGTYTRRHEPLRFWVDAILLGAAYLAIALVGCFIA